MIEYMILKYGLNYMPASVNIIAKRIGVTETERNLGILRNELERLVGKKKAFKSGNRFAIDTEGAKTIAKTADTDAMSQYPTPKNFKKAFKEFVVNQ